MKALSPIKGFLLLALAALFLGGCADKMEPAKKAISDVEAVLGTVDRDVERFAPDQLKAVKKEVVDLKTKFVAKDYKSVLAEAPKVLEEAKGLAPAAATKKAAYMAELPAKWAELSTAAPAALAELENRVAAAPAGVDPAAVNAARTIVSRCKAMWTMAGEAHAGGNLDQAVGYASYVKEKSTAALATLGTPAG